MKTSFFRSNLKTSNFLILIIAIIAVSFNLSAQNNFTIEQVMAKNLIKVTSKTTVKEVAEILSKKEFHAIPVVDNNKLVGIVTTTDLINYLLEQFNEEILNLLRIS